MIYQGEMEQGFGRHKDRSNVEMKGDAKIF